MYLLAYSSIAVFVYNLISFLYVLLVKLSFFIYIILLVLVTALDSASASVRVLRSLYCILVQLLLLLLPSVKLHTHYKLYNFYIKQLLLCKSQEN